MERNEFAVWVALLQTYYEKFQPLNTTEKIEIWYRELGYLPANALTAALRKYVSSGKKAEFPPCIADLKTICNELIHGEIPDWGEGWDEVRKAIRRYGYMEEAKALESLSPITRKAVQRIGWQDICFSENPDTIRAQFRQVFETMSRREAEVRNISPDLQALISSVNTGLLPEREETT